MGKFYKAALVLFYLLQLIIVFHEQVMHLFENAASPIHGSTDSQQESRNGFLKKLRHAMEQHHSADVVLHSSQRTHRIDAVLHKQPEPEQEVHHEEKNTAGRKPRDRRLPVYLIANLFPSIKKRRSRLAGKRAARCLDLSRFINYPSSEKGTQAA